MPRPHRVCLPLVVMFWIVSTAAAASIDSELARIKQVAGHGQGNQDAAQAWRELSRRGPEDIPAILVGMDDANPLAANWIRAAVDAIAERTLRSGQPLPADKLEAMVTSTQHASRPRELAFDWLTRIDATATERLIPQMLDDPALPFRRRAVAQLIDAAETTRKSDPAKSLALYRQAFEKSRDIDQVKDLAQKLKELGQPVDVTDHLGFITQWRVIGPFDNTDGVGFEQVYAPEEKIDLAAEYDGKSGPVRWIEFETEDEFGVVDLNKALGKANGVVGYALAEFESPEERDIEVRTGTGNANKVWLNGQLLTESRPYHGNDEIDQYVGRGRLKQGKNVILLKVLQNEQTESWAQKWEFQCRVCDALGTAVVSSNRPSAKPKADKLSAVR